MFKGVYDLIVLIIIGLAIYEYQYDVFVALKYFVIVFVLLGIRRIVFGKWIR